MKILSRLLVLLLALTVLTTDTLPAHASSALEANSSEAFRSAVATYVIVELKTNSISDDLLAIKILNAMSGGDSMADIYMLIYRETRGDIPPVLLPFYPYIEKYKDANLVQL